MLKTEQRQLRTYFSLDEYQMSRRQCVTKRYYLFTLEMPIAASVFIPSSYLIYVTSTCIHNITLLTQKLLVWI